MWNCSACTYRNNTNSLPDCEICGTTRNGIDTSVADTVVAATTSGTGSTTTKQCPKCTLFNDLAAMQCTACECVFIGAVAVESSSESENTLRKRRLDEFNALELPVSVFKDSNTTPTVPSPLACHDDLIGLVRACLASQPKVEFKLCDDVSFLTQKEDTDGNIQRYGCGYRNIQMLCSSIVKAKQSHPNYFKESLVPALWDSELSSIRGVQELIMQAWQGGMDVAGAELLNWDIIGTKKWIGATECVALMRHLQVSATVVDFMKSPVDKKIETWVVNYFNRPNPTGITRPVSPLYFQHEGHSRTIIGYEKKLGKINLLVFDPMQDAKQLREALTSGRNWQSMVKRGIHTLKHSQYQIVYLSTGGSSLDKVIVAEPCDSRW